MKIEPNTLIKWITLFFSFIGIWSLLDRYIINPDWVKLDIIKASIVEQGEYRKAINAIIDTINSSPAPVKVVTTDDVYSTGSLNTLDQIESGQASLGLVQSNVDISHRKVNAVAHVFKEYYMMLIRNDINPSLLTDPHTRYLKICTLKEGSQSIEDLRFLRRILSTSLQGAGFDLYGADFGPCASDLESKQADGAFFVTGLGNEVVARLIEKKTAKLIEIPFIKDYISQEDGVFFEKIEKDKLGNNLQIGTAATYATLVVNDRLSEISVSGIYSALFDRRERHIMQERYAYFNPEKIADTHRYHSKLHAGVPLEAGNSQIFGISLILSSVFQNIVLPIFTGTLVLLLEYFIVSKWKLSKEVDLEKK